MQLRCINSDESLVFDYPSSYSLQYHVFHLVYPETVDEPFIEVEEAWDYEENFKLRTEDCTQHLVPTTLGKH